MYTSLAVVNTTVGIVSPIFTSPDTSVPSGMVTLDAEVFEKIKQHYYLLEDENNNTDLSFDEYWSKNNLETIEYYSNYEYEII
jgi:hypothetical protein